MPASADFCYSTLTNTQRFVWQAADLQPSIPGARLRGFMQGKASFAPQHPWGYLMVFTGSQQNHWLLWEPYAWVPMGPAGNSCILCCYAKEFGFYQQQLPLQDCKHGFTRALLFWLHLRRRWAFAGLGGKLSAFRNEEKKKIRDVKTLMTVFRKYVSLLYMQTPFAAWAHKSLYKGNLLLEIMSQFLPTCKSVSCLQGHVGHQSSDHCSWAPC